MNGSVINGPNRKKARQLYGRDRLLRAITSEVNLVIVYVSVLNHIVASVLDAFAGAHDCTSVNKQNQRVTAAFQTMNFQAAGLWQNASTVRKHSTEIMPLPPFELPTIYDLRRLWVERKGDREVRNLILEIERTRRKMREIQDLVKVVDKCWKADVGGSLVALENLRVLLLEERWRDGTMDESPRK